MPRIAVVSFSDLARDPRVDRQLRFLRDAHEVTAIGWKAPDLDGVRFVGLFDADNHGNLPTSARTNSMEKRPTMSDITLTARVRRLLAGGRRLIRHGGRRNAAFYEERYWSDALVRRARDILAALEPDVVIANDIDTVPLALAACPHAGTLFDAHEYSPREFEDRLWWRLAHQPYRRYLCNTYVPRVDAMTTVGRSIARAYAADTGLEAEILTNAPDYENLAPTPVAADGRIRLVHHGAAIASRKIERMIRLVDHLDERFELDLFLAGDEKSLARLRPMAETRPRVRFREPVAMRSLPRVLNSYDIGLFLLAPTNFNYVHAMPNKLFEFVQARLAVAVGPSPDMAEFVRERGIGVVSETFAERSLAERLNALSVEDLRRFKEAAHRSARACSSEPNRRLLLRMVERLAVGRSTGGETSAHTDGRHGCAA